MTEQKNTVEKSNNRHDSLSGIILGFIFIAAGAIFYLYELGQIFEWFWWLLFAIGALLLVEVILRVIVPRYRETISGKLIAGLILIGLSAGQILEFENWWPFLLIAVGLGIIISSTKQNT